MATGERPVRPLLWAVPVGVVTVLVDQAAKTLAVRSLTPGRPVPLWWTLQLNLTFNSGVAFSGIRGAGVWVVPIALVVVGVVLYMGRHVTNRWAALALGLIAGGAIGNIGDRLFRDHNGAVIDFLDLQWWPIFNVADMAIVAGALALMVSVLGEKDEDAGGEEAPADRDGSSGGTAAAEAGQATGAGAPGAAGSTGSTGSTGAAGATGTGPEPPRRS